MPAAPKKRLVRLLDLVFERRGVYLYEVDKSDMLS
jgi:hypothetical protein